MRITALFLILTLAACGQKKPSDTPSSTAGPAVTPAFRGEVAARKVTRDWSPEVVEISCGGNACPPQVGALLFVQGDAGKLADLMRCTATLIAPTQVLTTGHCVFGGPAYFVAGIGSGRQIRKVRRLVSRTFTQAPANANGERPELRLPSVAVFELEEAITAVQPMTVASGTQRVFDRLTAYVINETVELDENGEKKGLHLRLDNVMCKVRRHESIFPFDLRESPDLIIGFNCFLIKGNSGAALVAPGGEEIQAVQQGTVDQQDWAEAVRKDLGRDLLVQEKHDYVVATNLRCVQWPGKPVAGPCVKMDEKLVNARWIETQENAAASMILREYPSKDFEYTVDSSLLTFTLKNYVRDFDVVYLPKCHVREIGGVIQFPNEHVRLDFNEWGAPTTQTLKRRLIPAQVTARTETGVSLAMSWPIPFGRLAQPASHPNQKWGASFGIALPTCTGY